MESGAIQAGTHFVSAFKPWPTHRTSGFHCFEVVMESESPVHAYARELLTAQYTTDIDVKGVPHQRMEEFYI